MIVQMSVIIIQGRYLDYNWLSSIFPTNDAAFYFCRAKRFMRAAYQLLVQFGVDSVDIHYEIFGPSEDITN